MSGQTEWTDNRNIAGSAVARLTADVLLILMHAPTALGVSELARRAESSKSAVHRVLHSLVSRGFVEQTAGRAYQLGPAAAALGAMSLVRSRLESTAAPILIKLRDATAETTLLTRPVAGGRMHVAQYESAQEIRYTVMLGVVRPWHAGASGKALLASLDPETQARILREEAQQHNLSDRRMADIRAELAEIREQGYAVSVGELNPLAAAIAATVVDVRGVVVAAVSVVGPVARFSPPDSQKLAPLVLQACRDISARAAATGQGSPRGSIGGRSQTRASALVGISPGGSSF
jgi:IclR family acetate operon transcriptional repressor